MTFTAIQNLLKTAAITSAAIFSLSAHAHNSLTIGPLTFHHIHATPAPIQGGTGAVFVGQIDNKDNQIAKIIAAQSNMAERVELHIMKMEGNVMKMREVENIPIPAGDNQKIMAPGNEYHFMLMQLKQPLKIGDTLELQIEVAGHAPQKITIPVEKRAPNQGHGHHHHH